MCLLVACGGEGSSDPDASPDGGLPDASPPDSSLPTMAVTATNPDEGATGVPLDVAIAVTFDRVLAPESIGERSLVLFGAGEEVAGRVAATNTTLLFVVPTLEQGTEYTLTVEAAAIRGVDGAALAEDHVFSFTTGDTYVDGTSPRANDYLPLGCTFGFAPKTEYLLLGLDDVNNVQLRDPLEYNGPEPPEDPSADLVYGESVDALVTTRAKRAARGALDRDYQDEAVTISWSASGAGTLTLFDHGDEGPSSTALAVDLTIDDRPAGAYQYDIATGDVDGDCLDEILVVGVIGGTSAEQRLGKVWIFDDSVASHALLHTSGLVGEFDPTEGILGLDRVAIAAGNVDDDGEDEFVVAFHLLDQPELSVLVYDDATAEFAELGHEQVGGARDVPSGASAERVIRVGVGDADADQRDEVAVGWAMVDGPRDNCEGGMWLLEDATLGFAQLAEANASLCSSFDFAASELIRDIVFADLDGNGADELAVFGQVFAYQTFLDPPALVRFHDNGSCEADWSDGNFSGQSMAVGDVNGDGRDDLIVRGHRIQVHGCVEHPHYDPDTGELLSTTNHMELIDERGPFGSSPDGGLVVAVNVDEDSVVLGVGAVVADPDAPPPEPGEPQPTRFVEHSVYFGDNRLIALVAAPPCAEGIGQATDACSAGFGTSSGGSVSAGLTFSLRAGVLVGVEAEVQGGFLITTTLAKVEAEIAAEIEVSGYVTGTATSTRTITNSTGFDQDLVIFAATPYDRYVYGIRSHPDGDLIGEPLIVDIPQRTRVFAVSRDYYNATNGDQMDIDGTVLENRPGDLLSYPRRAELESYLAFPNIGLGVIGPVTVNEGTGSQLLEQDLEAELAVGGEVSMSVDSMAKVCGATICGGVTAGFSLGVAFEATVSTGTLFMSEVGAIDAAHFPTERYDYGLFAYMTSYRDPNGDVLQNFIVVNHWVD